MLNNLALSILMLLPGGALHGQETSPPDAVTTPADFFSELSYHMVGPSRGGRVTTVAGHPGQPGTFYMGATGGGVWKTVDYGQTWMPLSDGYFSTGSIGAIAVAESDANVVYVGTGSDGLRSNVIIGKGIYRSGDAGKTWEFLGLEKTGNIGAVLIHPQDPGLVYVAAIGNPFAPNPERGVYRSRDGGRSWEHVLFLSAQTGAVDLEFVPGHPEEIYATLWRAERKPWTIISGGLEGGVYKSTDAGESWQQLTEGLPQNLRGKGDLAVSRADPDRVYVLIEAPGSEGGVYRSDNRGALWRQVSDFQPIRNRPFYYTNLEAHPADPNVLWGMAEGFWRSEDAGQTWKRQSVPHGDNHDMWINPKDPQLFIQSNDGGANVTRDGGRTWSTQHNQPTAELYQVHVSDDFPYRLYAGQQDNTTISVPSRPSRYMPGGNTAFWEAHGGCETGPAVPKPGDPDIVYANCKGRFGVFNRRTGQEMQYYVGFENLYGHNPRDLRYRFQRVAPIHVSPHDSNRVYHASQYVHMTDDGGKTWEQISPDLTAFTPETQVVSGEPITIDVTGEEHFSTLYVLQESPHEPGVIWAGSNDGPVHITRDGGRNWTDVTPQELGPYGRVQTIEVSPHEPARAYVAVLRYQLGDFRPYVFRTSNYGASWVLLTGEGSGIPGDYPVRVVREDPESEGLLFAGTEFGMFVSFDDGEKWHSFQLNLPVTPVTDIKIVEGDLVLSTMGRGFWILDNLTPLQEYQSKILSGLHLFQVRDVYRLYQPESGRAARPEEPDYPSVGARIDFYLHEDASEEVRLQIYGSGDQLVREFSSVEEGKPEEGDKPPQMEDQGMPAGQEGVLPRNRGFHRFVWDLRHPGPWKDDSGREAGPMVPPGSYEARLSVGSQTASRTFEVKLDPRVQAEGVTGQEVTAQATLALSVRDVLSEARRLAARVMEQLEKSESPRRAALEGIRDRLMTPSIRYSRPRLIDQLEYLYANLIRADQAPGRDAFQRLEKLREDLGQVADEFVRLPEEPGTS